MAALRVGIVGGGLAGLAAAVELKQARCEVELFERSRILGGRATSFRVNGHEVDNGQHVFLACYTEFLQFVRRVGMAGHLHLQDRFDVLVLSRRGLGSRLRSAALPAPWHLVSSFIGYRHLGWAAKVEVARALAHARWAKPSGRTFAEWLAGLGQGEEALRGFWRPFFVPALNAPLDRVSAADAGFVLRTAFLQDPGAARIGYCTVPLAHLAAAAAEQIDTVHLSTPVVGLDFPSDHRAVVILGGGVRKAVDAVVVAVPPPQLASLLGGREQYGIPPIKGYESRPIVDVHLWHDRGHLGFDLAALLDSPVQWVFEKARGYLCCSLSAADNLVQQPTADLVGLCWQEVRTAIPALAQARLLHGAATRTPEGTFLASPGVARPGPQTAIPDLAIAGSWTDTGWPDTLESAVRSGHAAARHLLGALRETPWTTH
jgi:squalene-associated FAD-dependent desaturase